MALFAIGDLHLSLGGDKPMDIFGGWKDYVQRLEANWRRLVSQNDTVVLAGDTSWAMALEDAGADFAFIQALPGKKLLIKGNHDYWWSTRSKMEAWLARQGFDSIGFIFNSFAMADGVCLCGSRGWMNEPGIPADAKVMAREVGRLRFSLQLAQNAAPDAERVAFLHYPPLYPGSVFQEIIDALHAFGVRRCYYGHLHGPAIRKAVQGGVDGIDYRLISADALGFEPLHIEV